MRKKEENIRGTPDVSGKNPKKGGGFTLIKLLAATPVRKTLHVFSRGRSPSAFTLVELLVVIAILAALAVAVVIIINPAEFIKRGRDSTRLSDLASLNKVLGLLLTQNYDDSFGDPNIVYTSLPDTDDSLPEDCDEYSLPSLPDGWSYSCRLISNFRNVDGSGWVSVDLTAFSTGSPLAVLPVDPVNSATTGLYYTYKTGSFYLTTGFESSKYVDLKMPNLAVNGGFSGQTDWVDSNLDGLADYWSTNGGGTSIISGSGFSGNAQRWELISSSRYFKVLI